MYVRMDKQSFVRGVFRIPQGHCRADAPRAMAHAEAKGGKTMNYFGLIFSFTLPGIALGTLIALALVQAAGARRRAKAQERRQRPLYNERLKREEWE